MELAIYGAEHINRLERILSVCMETKKAPEVTFRVFCKTGKG